MKRIKLTVAYDGTNYCGWQVQPNGITVQEVLERCLEDLTGKKTEIIGASRTDAGVHALGNVAVFDTDMRMPGEKFSFALNQRLPEDIRIEKAEEVPGDFHPRYWESEKTYVYRILNRQFPIPTQRLYTHFTYVPLDIEKMAEAGRYLVGEHDFKSFCGAGAQVKTTVRRVQEVSVVREDDLITIKIRGKGFLYNMVRIIAGTLMEIGGGMYSPEHMKEILEARDRQAAGPTAPARGLTLMGIQYLEERRESQDMEGVSGI